jgi:hypothetical protein
MQERHEKVQNSLNLLPRSISATGIVQKATSRAEIGEIDFRFSHNRAPAVYVGLIQKVDRSVEEGWRKATVTLTLTLVDFRQN